MGLLRWNNKVRWFVVLMIGTLTGTLACCIDISIKTLSHYKYTWLQTSLKNYMIDQRLYVPFFLWAALNVGPTIVASICGSWIEVIIVWGSVIKLISESIKLLVFHNYSSYVASRIMMYGGDHKIFLYSCYIIYSTYYFKFIVCCCKYFITNFF